MELNHSSCWDSIQEKVRPHIPTIDSDDRSSSDNEEMITLYQRPAGLSLKVPEDFDSFSMGDDNFELLKPAAHTPWSEETLDDADDADADEIFKGPPETQNYTQCVNTDAEGDACEGAVMDWNRAKQASVKENVVNKKSNEGFPVLSFARLDQWNLDHVLQDLKEGGPPRRNCVLAKPMETHAGDDKVRSEGNIMERLTAFFKSQSTQSVSEPLKSPNHIRENNTWIKSSNLQLSNQDCPTVHIDLHRPDPLTKNPKTSLPANNLQVQTESRVGSREVTGKSMLLRKIREMKSSGSSPPMMHSDSLFSVQEKLPHPVESTSSHEVHHPREEEQSPHAQSELRTTKMNSPKATQQSVIEEPKQENNQHRQQIGPTLQQEHRKILKQLRKHCPTMSVNKRQPSAEKTDILCHIEASYLQPFSTLPADTGSKGRMVLIVNLSSPGVVGDRAHVYPAATKSHIYNTLVAWFLSLVGPESRHAEEVGTEVPFWVAGLQQLWTEDGLALHVLAVAHRCYTPKKKQRDIHMPFYNHVCRFLSESTLPLIAPWLPQLQSLLGRQSYAPTIHLPATRLSSFISTNSQKKLIDQTFGVSPGFYWQTVEPQENVCKGRDTNQELHTEVSVSLGCEAVFLNPLKTHYTLQLVLDSGLDVCGLRLLYPPHSLLSDRTGAEAVTQATDETCHPVLAMAVRGAHAHLVLKDLTTYYNQCRSQYPLFLSSPLLVNQVHRELCLWFSGRLTRKSAQAKMQHPDGTVPPHKTNKGSMFNSCRSPSSLCATTKADLLLMVSPVAPPCCYGQVLAVCERRGFGLMGLQRLEVQRHWASVLGLNNQQTPVFCSTHNVVLDQKTQEPSLCLVLMLRKENAVHHSVRLPAALMRELEAQKHLGCIHERLDLAPTVEPALCFHTVPYSADLFHIFVRCMWAVPDPSHVTLSRHKCSSTLDMEQVVILALVGKDLSQDLILLHRVLTDRSKGGAFQLLGLKFLPALTRPQAQELTPYEVGEQLYNDSVNKLTSSPALVCALSRVEAFASLRTLLPHDYPANIRVLASATPEVAFRQASVFFLEHEMTPAPQIQLTVCLFKPTIWQHALTKTVHKLQLNGLVLVGLRVFTLDKSTAAYVLPSGNESADLEAQVEDLCSGSSLALCLEGEDAVRRLLGVLGRPDMASSYDEIYGSGSYQTAIEDVKKLFPEGLCCSETSTLRQEQILRVCSDSLASVEREQRCTLASVAHEHQTLFMDLGPHKGSLIHRARWQTTCLLIAFDAPPLSRAPSQLELLEQLLRSGCYLVAGRMSVLDNEQRKHIAEIVQVSSGGNERMAQFDIAPCLILALQGDTVVTCFDTLLDSIIKERPDLEKVSKTVMYPESEKEAEKLICFLFDALSSESSHNIVPQGSNLCTCT
ncbi:uncharacterized protein LOC117832438 [Notolabrus celidotus]|uniref:uncharacterized protein LOC117832438 n=1 Tax=Notolabrus celidotus TaxID=1203425 RepID=UPI00148FC6BA|nr:uncharacterized protein LOC117832438 [Notolabrus celidotus]